MNPAIAGGRAAERVRSTERSGSVERLRLHGDGFRAHGDRPPSRHVPLHVCANGVPCKRIAYPVLGRRIASLTIGFLLGFKEPKRVSYALARFGPTTSRKRDRSDIAKSGDFSALLAHIANSGPVPLSALYLLIC